jgi:hypothetical protein
VSLREIWEAVGGLQYGEAVGGLQYPAVSDAVRRTSARLETDRALEKKVQKALQNLETSDATSSRIFFIGYHEDPGIVRRAIGRI